MMMPVELVFDSMDPPFLPIDCNPWGIIWGLRLWIVGAADWGGVIPF